MEVIDLPILSCPAPAFNKIAVEIESNEVKVAHVETMKNASKVIKCHAFAYNDLTALCSYLHGIVAAKTDCTPSLCLIADNDRFHCGGVAERVKAELDNLSFEHVNAGACRVTALRGLLKYCRREDWIELAAFSPEKKKPFSYDEFRDHALTIFNDQQEIANDELNQLPALFCSFNMRNQFLYVDESDFIEITSTLFNASYMLSMAQSIARYETLGELTDLAARGSAARTSVCINDYPGLVYSIFDTAIMKDVFEGRTTYVLWPFGKFSACEPFTREDSARTIIRTTTDTFFFAALNKSRFHKVRSLFIAGGIEGISETMAHSVKAGLPMLDKFNTGEKLNVYIIKPASHTAVIGALLAES